MRVNRRRFLQAGAAGVAGAALLPVAGCSMDESGSDEHPNVLLLIMSIPLVGLFVRILRVRAAILAPITALITILGAYTIRNSMFDVLLVVLFGVLGYLMKKFGFEPGPLVLAFVLGELLESNLRRSLLVLDGDLSGFFTRPITAVLLMIFVLVAVGPMIKSASARRRTPDTTRVPADSQEKS